MRLIPFLLIAALCAAACVRRTAVDDDDDAGNRLPEPAYADDRFAAPADVDESQRKAAAAIRDIEDRMELGKTPRIQFEFDKDDITPESDPTLDLIANVLLSDDHLKLMISAHADSIGTDEYNLDLSRRRAKSVKTYLTQKGVYPPSVRFHGFGSSMPIADNATDAGRAKNRRVEFRIMTREWKAVY